MSDHHALAEPVPAGDLTDDEAAELLRREALHQRALREAEDWADTARIIEQESRSFCAGVLRRLGLDPRHRYRFDPAAGRVVLVAAWTPAEGQETDVALVR